jgi:hypothetical protein
VVHEAHHSRGDVLSTHEAQQQRRDISIGQDGAGADFLAVGQANPNRPSAPHDNASHPGTQPQLSAGPCQTPDQRVDNRFGPAGRYGIPSGRGGHPEYESHCRTESVIRTDVGVEGKSGNDPLCRGTAEPPLGDRSAAGEEYSREPPELNRTEAPESSKGGNRP